MKFLIGFGLVAFVLVGCASLPAESTKPQVVTVVKTSYIPIPSAYLMPCTLPVGVPTTNLELLKHDQEAMFDLSQCNKQLTEIKNLTLAPSSVSNQ